MKDVNLLLCSDLHASEEALELVGRLAVPKEYDLVLICGDFTTYGSLDYVNQLLKRIKDVLVLAVPGNCDMPEIVPLLEKEHASLHNRRVEFGGWQFFGFGGSIPTSAGMPFEVDEKVIESSLRKIAVKRGVMVTHQPAYGINDMGRSGRHGGSKLILKIAQEFVPRLAVAGHLHESRGIATAGDTLFVNPGSARNGSYASIWLGDEVRAKLYHEKISDDKPKMY
jgi:Icc-related predicted phosphoesterase